MIRIVIVDDHAIVRRGLRQILADSSDMAVTAECADGQELLRLLAREQFDIALMDVSMPGRNGIDLIKQVKGVRPGLPVLILSMHPEEQYAIRALKMGARGYITKESAPDELVKAIRKVAEGGVYISSALAERLALSLGNDGANLPHESLSDREYQILCLIASGKTVKVIAEQLSLSIKTISTYRTRLLAKMRMKSNAELSTYAIRNGLVD